MRVGVAQGGTISPLLFSLYVYDVPSPSQHVELALYVDDTAVIATSRQPALLVKYLEAYLRALERWLSEWRIAIMSRRALPCSSSRPVDASRNLEQYISSESQWNGSMTPVILW